MYVNYLLLNSIKCIIIFTLELYLIKLFEYLSIYAFMGPPAQKDGGPQVVTSNFVKKKENMFILHGEA